MLRDDFAKVAKAKTAIRKAIQTRNTGLTLSTLFTEYPPYIRNIHKPNRTVNTDGIVDYCEDNSSNFTVKSETIRDFAFYNYTTLKNLVITVTNKVVTLQGSHVFTNTLIEKGLGKIYVPASLVNQYKTAKYWKKYANLIMANTNIPAETITHLVETEETVRNRTVEWFNSLPVEKIIKDNRA